LDKLKGKIMERSTVLETAFDVENEEGTPPRELLPKGKYTAEIIDASVAPTKNGKGQMVHLSWCITEGEHENRYVFQSIIIQHESADAQRFGRQKFKDVCVACGITDPVSDLSVLQYKPCSLYVVIEQDKTGQYPDKNKVGRVQPYVANWNGSRELLKEASTVPPSDKSEATDLNDSIPF
jgi:Protein of unknown function (DUF669)